jgi:hypothetical protein
VPALSITDAGTELVTLSSAAAADDEVDRDSELGQFGHCGDGRVRVVSRRGQAGYRLGQCGLAEAAVTREVLHSSNGVSKCSMYDSSTPTMHQAAAEPSHHSVPAER